MSNFSNGLKSASDYINTTTVNIPTVNIPTGVDIDLNTGVVTPSITGFSLKELICALLAGNGLKLPNLQICLKINIGRLLGMPGLPGLPGIPGIPGMPADLKNALAKAEATLDKFIAHTNIDNVLGRLNAAIAEFAAIANMINFCGTPIQPRPIPNVLRDIMGSFIGAGKNLLDKLGTMVSADIGGCIGAGGGFNPNVFTSGLLKDIGQYANDFSQMPANVRARIISDLNAFSSDMENLVKFENNFSGTDNSGDSGGNNGNGGSTFSPSRVNTEVGVAIDTGTLTLSDSQRMASNIKGLYDSLSAYKIDETGTLNVFDYLLEPELILKLQDNSTPVFPLQTRDPVYDYCGRVIGYTTGDKQAIQPTSAGSPVENIIQPGVVGLKESGVVINSPPATTVNLANLNPIVKSVVPTTTLGSSGDKRGDIVTSQDGSYIYIAHADYDGVTAIWSRASLNTW